MTIRACLFDAYGTLFDVHSAIGRHRTQPGAQANSLSAMWRMKQLEYTWLRSLMGQYADFVAGARAYGFQAAWINRTGAPVEELGSIPTCVIGEVGEVPGVQG